jgi:hypothetical protein
MPTGDADNLDDDEWLTHYVFKGKPNNAPRPQDADGVSTLRGRLPLGQAASYVRRKGLVFDGDGVRYARVGDLRAAGFVVTPTPTRRIAIHVSVSREAEWSHSEAMQFASCFEIGG